MDGFCTNSISKLKSKHQISRKTKKKKMIPFFQNFHFFFLQTPSFSELFHGNFLISFFPIIINHMAAEESGHKVPPVFSHQFFSRSNSENSRLFFIPNNKNPSLQFLLLLRVIFHYLVNTAHLYI